MSRGMGAHANKIHEDDLTVTYEYGGYNLNRAEYMNENRLYDGRITITKICFGEPEMHKKIKKMPSGRKKKIIKRVPVSVKYGQMIEDGLISIKNCSNCWRVTDNTRHIDCMVLHILFYLFQQYQEEGVIPEFINYNV